MKTFSLPVSCTHRCQDVVVQLVSLSQWFQVEPLPDDDFTVTVKAENEALLKAVVESRR